jgi:hypothetical protein
MNTDALFDELEKIAIRLNDEERRRQAGQFAALGAVTAPAVAGAKNLAIYGKVAPWRVAGAKGLMGAGGKGRWLAGTMAAGAVAGGVMPSIRHGMERNFQADAKARRKTEREAALSAR